jgi:putative aldouronate transport system permease protein
MKYSVVFIASAPMLVAYPFVQKYFVKGVMIGSLKG